MQCVVFAVMGQHLARLTLLCQYCDQLLRDSSVWQRMLVVQLIVLKVGFDDPATACNQL